MEITNQEIQDAIKIASKKYSIEELVNILNGDGLVVKELQKGYKMGDRIIRPAKVVVLKYAVEIYEPRESINQSVDSQPSDKD